MNRDTKIKQEIANLSIGKWITKFENEGKTEKIIINIKLDKVSIVHSKEGKEILNITINGNAHWFGNYLCFMDAESKYYIRGANKNYLIFGEHKWPIIGSTVWEYKFERINKQIKDT